MPFTSLTHQNLLWLVKNAPSTKISAQFHTLSSLLLRKIVIDRGVASIPDNLRFERVASNPGMNPNMVAYFGHSVVGSIVFSGTRPIAFVSKGYTWPIEIVKSFTINNHTIENDISLSEP